MKALRLHAYGKIFHKNLSVDELDRPLPGVNDVVIEVDAAALNPVDYKMARGKVKIVLDPPTPFSLGFDVAGRIIAKGMNILDFKVGDSIYAKVPWSQMGTIATHCVIDQDYIASVPSSISMPEAAGLPLVGCTVMDSFRIGKLQKGMKILILGGSGGIGSFAIQYAKYLGAEVFTTTSTKNLEWVKALGADHVIDYTKEDYRKKAQGVDFVYDTLGGPHTSRAIRLIKKGGTIISIAGHYDTETLKEVGVASIYIRINQMAMSVLLLRMRLKKITYKHVWSQPNRQKLEEIARLVDAGEIRPIIDRVYPFEETINALYYLQTNRAKGKVVVSMRTVEIENE